MARHTRAYQAYIWKLEARFSSHQNYQGAFKNAKCRIHAILILGQTMTNHTMCGILRYLWRFFCQYKTKSLQLYNRLFHPPKWHNLRFTQPISKVFGFDRGTPIDRIYTDDFLKKNAHFIQGRVCEIAENTYTKTFGSNVTQSEILHYTKENPNATIIGDLTQHHSLPQGILDCFICTVTLNFIYDYKMAIKGIYLMLKSNGGGGYE